MRRPITLPLLMIGVEVSFFSRVAGAIVFAIACTWEMLAWPGE